MKYRVKYSKQDKMKFIGHLDLLRLFTRAVNRSGIPVSYSQGFNPHQLLSFAFPLAIGMETVGDYCDIDTNTQISEETVNTFKNSFPAGLKILNVRQLADNEKNCAACTEFAKYEISFRDSFYARNNYGQNRCAINFNDIVEAMLSSKEIIATRKTKSGLKDSDIRQDIYSLEYDDSVQIFNAVISAGSGRNLKADDLMAYLLKQKNAEFLPYDIKYKRVDIFRSEGSSLIPLGEGSQK